MLQLCVATVGFQGAIEVFVMAICAVKNGSSQIYGSLKLATLRSSHFGGGWILRCAFERKHDHQICSTRETVRFWKPSEERINLFFLMPAFQTLARPSENSCVLYTVTVTCLSNTMCTHHINRISWQTHMGNTTTQHKGEAKPMPVHDKSCHTYIHILHFGCK